MRVDTRRLSVSDWVFIGYVVGLLVWWVYEAVTADPDTGSRTWTEQSMTLSEDHLQRLEDGDSVKLSRWHGGDLVLDGTIVVDAGRPEEGHNDP